MDHGGDSKQPLLDVRDLGVTFFTDAGPLEAAVGVSFQLRSGRTLGLVGESGCGKSVTALSLLRLVPPPGRITGGRVVLDGQDLVDFSEDELADVRGRRLSMIFQEPMSALNPVFSVGDQVAEVLRIHDRTGRKAALDRAVAMLDRVGIADASRRAGDYPHHLSGGMRQRVMIAMALVHEPDILIADEPTTALDVTVQAQILDLMLEMQRDMGLAILFISHDLGVISEVADEVMVMYAGRVVEHGTADDLFRDPRHPYTRGLLETLPSSGSRQARLPAIPGVVPDPRALPPGCSFSDRCPLAEAWCQRGKQSLAGDKHRVACWKGGP
jgi:peptide/nickel transport system ATP-binding protein